MALPRKLKRLNVFLNGENWVGEAEDFTPAKLTRKFEAYRGGGMGGAVNIDMGFDDSALDVSFTFGGYGEPPAALHGGTQGRRHHGALCRLGAGR
ncbi:phage major tail tube protein [Aeromonas veronii]|uniref:phage major tail tube protein n=1 Tax=Aeromonas veronii TaxID=654 RepID=UPI003BA155AB